MPDKAHLHHRLMAMGFSHLSSVLIIYAISGFFGTSAVILSMINNPRASVVLALLLLAVVVGAEKIGICTGKTAKAKSGAQARNL